MPFLLGSLMSVAMAVIAASGQGIRIARMPDTIRFPAIALIGVLIGSRVTPDLVNDLPALWRSVVLVFVYVMLAQAIGYTLLRKNGFDAPTAICGGMPGGLVDAVELGRAHGADSNLLTVIHFARVILVVTIVPFAFSIIEGHAVGSAAGLSFETHPWTWGDLGWTFVLACLGMVVGKMLKLPAWHLLGAMLVTGVVHGMGWLELSEPNWLVNSALLVIGVSLGTQFSQAEPRMLKRGFIFALGFVALMLLVALPFGAAAVWFGSPMQIKAGYLSFAPGGIVEMGLIALSLHAAPVLVSAHHVVRIFFTVFFAAWLIKRINR